MNKSLFLAFALLLGPGWNGVLPARQQAPQAATPAQAPATVPAAPALPPIPPDDAAKVNPLKPTAEGLAKAKKTYGYDCAVCHGEKGDGKGDLGVKYNLKDWTDAASLQAMTDGELFYIVTHGRGQMPSEGSRVTPDEAWNLVLLVRSYSRKAS